MSKFKRPEDLADFSQQFRMSAVPRKFSITVCGGTSCQACGGLPVAKALKAELARQNLEDEVHFRASGCHGFCEQGPLLVVEPGNMFYCHVEESDAAEIVERTIKGGEAVERLLYLDPASGKRVVKETEIPFYAKQNRVLLGDNLKLSPKDIEEYIALGGYSGLAKALARMTPQSVIEEVKASGLRGRGGGGYLTGRKWEQCRAASGQRRYVVCNADEGVPGAYMDRTLLEGNPHSILEGMIIGAYAIGAARGFVYVRREYPLAVIHIRTAIEQARQYGLLGDHILGSELSFDVDVVRGGGAFICGESSALMASLEGRVPEPRTKDIHAVERGYLGHPTNLNNVETWASVPHIIVNGSTWFAARGTASSKGTKILALTGQVQNTGLVEVNMGTSLRKIIFEIGGGPKTGRQIKMVQTGGPPGGCLPVAEFHLPLDFEALAKAGSMMGGGAMVVMDDSACPVDVAKCSLGFLQEESCGKCVPCRVGISRMLEIVTDIADGRGTMEKLQLLEELAWTVSVGSLCGLGKTAPNPVLSTLRYFREEYVAHIQHRRCPAHACRALIRYVIHQDGCAPCCAKCADACPGDAIKVEEPLGFQFVINDDLCSKCGICAEICPEGTIHKVSGMEVNRA